MFRARTRPESPSRPTAARGSVGSAKVWDEHTRARRRAPEELPAEPQSPTTLEALVAGIVQLTLDERRPHEPAALRAERARALEHEILRLLATPRANGIEADAPPASAPAPQAELPPELAPVRPRTPMQRALELVLEDRLGRLGGPLAERPDLRGCLIGLALELLERPAPSADASASPDELRNLDVLQRRAAKLERSLQEARAALSYVSELEHVDEGIASIYRQVQGLAPDDPQRENKRDALQRIFRANLALQKGGAEA